ncbi:telomere-protecting terminal protein Tpg [Streptomyces sp. NPDC056638]|uniref:telomere-protecting terminal protein Tpg n=1 Tax=Streptomyces sp. NPDC056638 TaxID=3345887 RepID=UPI00368218AD
MTDEEKAQQAARTRAKIMEGPARAERALFTPPVPKSARARMKFLRKQANGSTKSLAERLGVSRKTVQRYLSDVSTKPNKRLQAALVQETESSGNRRSERRRGSTRPLRADSSSSSRPPLASPRTGPRATPGVWDLSIAVPPSHAALILVAQEEGATDTDLHEAVAEVIADAYFRQGGGGRAGLKVNFTDVEWLNIEF